MLARLWWKDVRTYWTLGATVAALAVVAQWLMARSGLEELRRGLLTPIALLWSALYAFAISSAAFAGEREGRTLLFLDALPVSRRALWFGKLTYALVSTLVLSTGLFIYSMLGTEAREDSYALGPIVVGYGVLLVEAVAWGLFWSALLRNVLGAAALAVGTVGLIVTWWSAGLART